MNKPDNLFKLWFDIFGKAFLGYRWKCVKQPNYSTRTIQCYNGLNIFTIGFKREENWIYLEKRSRYRSINNSLKRKFGEEFKVNEATIVHEIKKYCSDKTKESFKTKGNIKYSLEEFIEFKNKL